MESIPESESLYLSRFCPESLTCRHKILSSLYVRFPPFIPLFYQVRILQMDNIHGLVKTEFHVRPSLFFFFFFFSSSLPIIQQPSLCCFVGLTTPTLPLILCLLTTTYSYSYLSRTFILDCPARLQSCRRLHQCMGNLSQYPACLG